MITITDLHTALLELLEKIRESEIKLIIGGGFGKASKPVKDCNLLRGLAKVLLIGPNGRKGRGTALRSH